MLPTVHLVLDCVLMFLPSIGREGRRRSQRSDQRRPRKVTAALGGLEALAGETYTNNLCNAFLLRVLRVKVYFLFFCLIWAHFVLYVS